MGSVLLSSLTNAQNAGFNQPAPFQIKFKDSIVIQDGNSIIHNNIILTNRTRDSLPLKIELIGEHGWKSLSAGDTYLTLPRSSKKVIPVSLVNSTSERNLLSAKISILITDRRTRLATKYNYTYVLLNKPVVKFSIHTSKSTDVQIYHEDSIVVFPLTLKNEGNIDGNYHVEWELKSLAVKNKFDLHLRPGSDTVLRYVLLLRKSKSIIKTFNAAPLQVTVRDNNGHVNFFNWRLTYTSSVIKEHRSSYKTAPLTINMGYFSRGDATNFFASAYGSVALPKHSSFDYNYRSKDYTQVNRYQSDIFSLAYNSRNLKAYVGTIKRLTDFYLFGNEASITANWSKYGGVTLWGMKSYDHSITSNRALGAIARYKISHVAVEHTFSNNLDSTNHPIASLFLTTISLIDSKHLNVSLKGGLGADLPGAYSRSVADSGLVGHSLGYAISYSGKRFSVSSNIGDNSEKFPGNSRGQKLSNHSFTWNASPRVGITAFYISNRVTNNLNIDTLLNTNRLEYNSKRYGLKNTWKSKGTSFDVSLGVYENNIFASLPKYGYGDVNLSLNPNKNFTLSLSSQNGLGKQEGSSPGHVWFTNSRLSTIYKHLSLSGSYYQYPIQQINDPTLSLATEEAYTKTLSFSAGYDFRLFKNVSGNLNYQAALYSVNTTITHNILGNLTYSSYTNGLNVSVEGSIPIKTSGNDNASYLYDRNYIQVSLSKHFNIPVFTKKKYFDLKARLFEDINGDDIRQDDEPVLRNEIVKLNDKLFITDNKGTIAYRNLPPETYKIDLSNVNTTAGFIPAKGYFENVLLEHDVAMDIPYKRGGRITGSVRVTADDNSAQGITTGGLKITIADSTTVIGNTLTAEDGSFSFLVPEGIYKISLNREAFNDRLKPEQYDFWVDLTKQKTVNVVFQLLQKKREVHLLKR